MTLLSRVGRPLAAAIADLMIRCARHGDQPAVLACPCAYAGAGELAASSMDGVFCGDHVRRFEAEDPTADDDLEPMCFECLAERGVLLVGSPHASPAAAPAIAPASD